MGKAYSYSSFTAEECIAADEAVSRLPLVLLSKKLWFLAGYGISIE
jgi:hypothetical protein